MGTATVNTGLVLSMDPEVLGPGSPYELARLALRKEWAPVVEAAKAIIVTDQESAEEATKIARLLQVSSTEIDKFYTPVKREVDAFKKPILDAEKADLAEVEAQKKRLGAEITKYNQEQRRLQAERDREAREKAERDAREDLLARAVELEASGDLNAAVAVLDEPVIAPVVIQTTVHEKVRGQVPRKTYKCIVTDPRALLAGILGGVVPMEAIEINQGWLNRLAGVQKEAFVLPGCKLDVEESTNFRG